MAPKKIVIRIPRIKIPPLPSLPPVPPHLGVDPLTILLLGILASLLIYGRFFAIPRPLVHPLLLGKQAEVSSVRKKGESGIYRSFATGQGTPLTVRPVGGLKTVKDIVGTEPKEGAVTQRCILDTPLSDEALAEILRLLIKGIKELFPSTSSKPILTLLPPTPSTSLPLLLLQLASPSPLIILPFPKLLTSALKAPSTTHEQPGIVVVHESIVDDVLEQILEDCGADVGVLIVGDTAKGKQTLVKAAQGKGMKVSWWEDVWAAGESSLDGVEKETVYSDVHSYFYSQPQGQAAPVVTKFTQINITAGIAGLLSLFPADQRPSGAKKDVVASAERLDTPIGMTIALASVWSGAGFRLIGPKEATWDTTPPDAAEAELQNLVDSSEQPKPTILFITSQHHKSLLSKLHDTFLPNPFSSMITHQKISVLQAGYVGRDSIGDRRVLGPRVRDLVLGGLAGDQLRSVIIVGDSPPEITLGLSHLLLGLPLTRLHPSPYSAGPIFVSHYYDIQAPVIPVSYTDKLYTKLLDGSETRSHVGPPSSNVEIKLLGDGVEGAEGNIQGQVLVRGPGIGEVCGGGRIHEDGILARHSVETK